MERREPTFNAGNDNSSSADELARRPVSRNLDEPSRNRPAPAQREPQAKSSSLTGFALFIALLAAGAAGFLGWQFFQAQQVLQQANDRISVLEEQLNVSSQESNQSVLTLGTKLTKLADGQTKHSTLIETNRKTATSNLEKITAQAKEIAAVKQSAAEARSAVNSLKQELASNKSLVDASLAKIEPVVSQIEQKIETLNEDINKLELDMGNFDAIERRLRTAEDNLKAIDDFRRTTNREILQLKQQAAAPK
jgi:chromosome segregation ATPase